MSLRWVNVGLMLLRWVNAGLMLLRWVHARYGPQVGTCPLRSSGGLTSVFLKVNIGLS